jgi:hypothetical protein
MACTIVVHVANTNTRPRPRPRSRSRSRTHTHTHTHTPTLTRTHARARRHTHTHTHTLTHLRRPARTVQSPTNSSGHQSTCQIRRSERRRTVGSSDGVAAATPRATPRAETPRDGKYRCVPGCGEFFKSDGSRWMHRQECKSYEFRFKCSCGKGFDRERSLAGHVCPTKKCSDATADTIPLGPTRAASKRSSDGIARTSGGSVADGDEVLERMTDGTPVRVHSALHASNNSSSAAAAAAAEDTNNSRVMSTRIRSTAASDTATNSEASSSPLAPQPLTSGGVRAKPLAREGREGKGGTSRDSGDDKRAHPSDSESTSGDGDATSAVWRGDHIEVRAILRSIFTRV